MQLEKQWLGSFASEAIVCTTKVRDELLEIGKDLKIKHSGIVSFLTPPPSPFPLQSVRELFSHKKALHGGTTFFGQIFG